MLLRIENGVFDVQALENLGQAFGLGDRDRADQDGLAGFR